MTKENKTVKIDSGIYQHRDGCIAVTLNGSLIGSINDNPKSKRFNLHLYNAYKAVLIASGQWDNEIEQYAYARRR